MKLLLQGGTVVSGKECVQADILIAGSKITEVAPNIQCSDAKIVDVSHKLLFPGFIDAHTHFDLEVSGTVTADNFYTGTKAALSGGTTCIIDFATQNKGETLKEASANWHRKADKKSCCDYGFHMAMSDWNAEVSEELSDMIKEGITSFKVYMTYDAMILGDKEIYQVLMRLKDVGGIAGVHCENKGLIDALVEEEKAKGHLSPKTHPLTRPAAAEAEAVGRLLKLASVADTPVIVVHLSSAQGYEEIKNARDRGQKVYVETCPQYLLLNEERYHLDGFESAKYVIAPPLRKKEDQELLWELLSQNLIQTISTDHCSFTTEQKAMGRDDFTKIPCGMPGTEARAVLLYTYGVLRNRISLEQMCRLLTENPAKLYGMYPQKGCIQAGSDADIVVWDKDTLWEMTSENQVANVDYQPFEGFRVQGKAEQVYLRGKLVVNKGKVIEEKTGQYIARGRRIEIE